jgi:hypothetical protein
MATDQVGTRHPHHANLLSISGIKGDAQLGVLISADQKAGRG